MRPQGESIARGNDLINSLIIHAIAVDIKQVWPGKLFNCGHLCENIPLNEGVDKI